MTSRPDRGRSIGGRIPALSSAQPSSAVLGDVGHLVARDKTSTGGAAVAPLLTAEEVARLLGVAPSWVSREARLGRLPHVRLGRYRRFRLATIEAWIDSVEREPFGRDHAHQNEV